MTDYQTNTNSFHYVSSRVKNFFADFNDSFSDIDELFDKIDKACGNDSESLICIFDLLQKHHEKTVKYVEENYSNKKTQSGFISNDIPNKKDDLCVWDAYLIKVQDRLRELLSHDVDWENKYGCVNCISNVLEKVRSYSKENKDSLSDLEYHLAHILCELVADCSLSIQGVIPLSEWYIGTENYSLLSAEDKLLSLLNKAILIDRMYLSLHTLSDVVYHLNRVAYTFIYLDWKIYYYIGFLNYKIHNYKDAIYFFRKIENNETLELIDRNKWFHSNLLIAYCFEYQYKFVAAIEKLACPIDALRDFLVNIEYVQITNEFEDVLSRFITNIKELKYTSLITVYFKDKVNYNSLSDEQLEILHALAHCVNEHVASEALAKETEPELNSTNETVASEELAKETNPEPQINGKLVFFARELMRFIAKIEPEYITCYASIHGEYSDYSKAIFELQNARHTLKDQNKNKETIYAEIDFFEYYFNQMLGIEKRDVRERFENYCWKYSDNDAECHIKIFEFKNALKDYYSALSITLNEVDDDDYSGVDLSNVDIPPIDKLDEMYIEMCKLTPSLYMNINVRAELRAVQRAYACIKLFVEYLSKNNRTNKIEYARLMNALKRFHLVRANYDLDISKTSSGSDENLTIENALFDGIDNKMSVVYCLHNCESVFLLAPISGVVVFQYQTGKLNELFDESYFCFDEVIPGDMDLSLIKQRLIVTSVEYGKPYIHNISWDQLKPGAKIYCWRAQESDKLVVVSKTNTEIRRIIDNQEFSNLFVDLDITKPVKCSHRHFLGKACKVFRKTIAWTEIINETSKQLKILIYIHNQQDEEKELYIIPEECVSSKHQFHESIFNVMWESGYPEESGGTTSAPVHDICVPDKEEYREKWNRIDDLIAKLEFSRGGFQPGFDYADKSRLKKVKWIENIISLLKSNSSAKISDDKLDKVEAFLNEINDLDMNILERKYSDIIGADVFDNS